jgi:hypothetical protein
MIRQSNNSPGISWPFAGLFSASIPNYNPYSKTNKQNNEKAHEDKATAIHPSGSISVPIHHGYLLDGPSTFIVMIQQRNLPLIFVLICISEVYQAGEIPLASIAMTGL